MIQLPLPHRCRDQDVPDGPVLIYLLCFRPHAGPARHYIGSTTPAGLHQRLIDHAGGRGSRYTRAMVSAHGYLHLTRLWGAVERSLERRIKRRGNKNRLCPVCASGGRTAPLATYTSSLPTADQQQKADALMRVGFPLPIPPSGSKRG